MPSPNDPSKVIPCAQSRKTRPSPYQMFDQYLWSVRDGDDIRFEWSIPKKEVLSYILANPHEFDVEYVRMLRRFVEDKIEKLEDYVVDGEIA